MQSQKYKPFATNEIEPKGWLLQQLEIQAVSLSGNLDKVWPDIRDSKYVGGDREGWERVPYWLDGFIPLAYLLKDDDLISRGKRYIDAILARQCEDGWICPCKAEERADYDVWAMLLLSKVLIVHHDCSGDERIEPALYKAFKNLKEHLAEHPLFSWGKYRWFEGLIAIYWLYDRVKEEWLLELADMLHEQGTDYNEIIDGSRFQEAKREWTFDTHVVNMAQAIKSDALMSLRKGNNGNEFAEKMYSTLMKYHGTAIGHFTGDECLAGNSPIQGAELCSVVEAMYSYEQIFTVTGNPVWLDRLEMLAYNALPAAISPDMWTHQYDQMVNQIECSKQNDPSVFLTNSPDAHIYGLEPNYGCCTANFNQGWPKFALSTFYKDNSSIISAAIAPSKVTTQIRDAKVSVELQTIYPFKNKLKYIITAEKPIQFELKIRIPRWAKRTVVNEIETTNTDYICLNRIWDASTEVNVEFEFETKFDERPENMVCLRHGALCYSVDIKEEWKKIEYTRDDVDRVFPYCDYEVYPKSKWNYAFWNNNLSIKYNDIYDIPFSPDNSPITIIADMVEIDWGYEPGYDNVCARIPKCRTPISDVHRITLKPYGCSNLHITELPKLN
ncbi:MAG: hypothetical protein A2Y17_06705 [Clostridiales bacterium GWF2_38_85]|nr:MAG: hypothetical protein A2Y17_06705 [Clostridiales bacterium GWF2_38_85]HBL84905.1 hypothetical protein [Clostridiales bacterium]